ncbi:MAG TPA: hypothetical protein PKU84_11960, partial [Spirochaetota bacterium]|nr:hypothetical protein [Spirochaetota bacterium]
MKKIINKTMRVTAFFLVCALILTLPISAAKKKNSSQAKQTKQETVQPETAAPEETSAEQSDPAAVETS